jgi:hypothetical protein
MGKEVRKTYNINVEAILKESLKNSDDILNDVQEKKAEENAKLFFNLIKHSFGQLFDIRYQYTFEELIQKLSTITVKLESILKVIEHLKNKVDNTFVEEKDNPQLKAKIDVLEEKLAREYRLQEFYNKINSLLNHEGIRDLITSLSQKISEMEYGNEEITNEKITTLIQDYKEIINKILSYEETKDEHKKRNIFRWLADLFKGKKLRALEPSILIIEPELAPKVKEKKQEEKFIAPKEVKIVKEPEHIELKVSRSAKKLKSIIIQINDEASKKNILLAKREYLKALQEYKKLTVPEKEEVYRELLKIYH